MRLILMGSPAAALPTLKALKSSAHEICVVVTQPDKPAGRGRQASPCAVAAWARAQGLPLLQPASAKTPEFIQQIQQLKLDLAIIVAYGQILPQAVLEIPKHCCWNLHFSLLPKYRGAAPVNWALLNGERETGVTMMRLIKKLDAGPILKQQRAVIGEHETGEQLEERLAQIGATLCLQTLADFETGRLREQVQDETQASYAPMLQKADGHLDWKLPAPLIARKIRALQHWPGAFTYLPEGDDRVDKALVKIYATEVLTESDPGGPGTILHADRKQGLVVACGTGCLRITELQLAGKRRMSAQEFLSGHVIAVGKRLT